ncbi:hypothetical protein [Isoalcanivorax beigongshangi]|uniref:Adenylate kinase n=1 Tax=Isoalcanivorax beigongshangi TaxID=3238810 RepID=A0ABV4AHY0_9GAMM
MSATVRPLHAMADRPLPSLAQLGPRVVILGPSASGKSTLATRIAARQQLPVVHLDQLYHRPGSDWQPRPLAEFAAQHQAAVATPAWVMEGHYSTLLPARLARATGLIVLDASTAVSLWRYLRRTRTVIRGRAVWWATVTASSGA